MLLLAAFVLSSAVLDVTPAVGFEQAKAPSVALDQDGVVYVAFGQGNGIFLTHNRQGSFSKPIKIAEPKALALGMRRGPKIAVKGSTLVVTAIAGEQGKGKDENLIAWTSKDAGATWQAPVQLNDVPASAREGLHAMAYGGNAFVAAWLDMRSDGTLLYTSTSKDGLKWTKNVEAYRSPSGSICECCSPSVAVDTAGKPALMWRNWLDGNRDMYLLRNGLPEKLGTGSWKLNACPMDGGALAIDGSGAVSTIWRREGSIFVCEPGKEERMLGQGQQPWVAMGPQGPVYAWIQSKNGRLMLLEPGAREPRVVAEKANDPVLASSKSRVMLVWEDASGSARIRSLTLR